MRQKWVDRKFEFDFPASDYVYFLEFLKQTPAKVTQLLNSTS